MSLKSLNINPEKKALLEKLGALAEKKELEIYAVGGFVRDLFLNRETDEIDFVVVGDGPGFAKEARKHLRGRGFVVYEKFGTASFLIDNLKLEFVTARRESYQEDSRKPAVEESSLEDDLSRRDFTVNAMAMSIGKSDFMEIKDPFNGRKDLKKQIIRTPLNPEQTFYDDPLRIMRAARFASQLGFHIEAKTLEAMERECDRLKIVSRERITDEMMKILASPKPSIGFRILYETGLLTVVFPELTELSGVEQKDTYHHKDVFEHTLKVVDNIAEFSDDLHLRFSALVHDIAKPRVKQFVEGAGWTFHGHDWAGEKMLKKICQRMKLSKEMCKYVQKLTRLHMRPIQLVGEEVTDSAIRRLLVHAGDDVENLMILCRADITSGNPKRVKKFLENFDYVSRRMKEVEAKDQMRTFQSPVRGETIMEICGIGPGPQVGRMKKRIEEAILEGEIPNTYEAAYDYLVKIKDDALKDEKDSSNS